MKSTQRLNKVLLSFAFAFVVSVTLHAQQQLISLNRFYTREIEREMMCDSTAMFHAAAKPYLESDLHLTNVYGFKKDTTKFYTHEGAVLFKRHLFQINKDDFFLAVDPLFDFTLGKDLADTTYFKTQKMLTNQRGVQMIGDIGKKFSFQTSFYETQIVVPMYLKMYCDSTGIFPGWGRTKDYNQRGYDFGVSTSSVSYTPIRNLNFQFGNGKSFYGHGYRSILWSDAAFNYPYLKTTWTSKDGKLQYSAMYASLQTLERLPFGEVPESLFKRKGASVNYLSWLPTRSIEVGLFESLIWVRYDSTGTRPQPYGAYIPVIGVNTAINGLNGQQNAMLGVNLKVRMNQSIMVYGQFAADDPSKKAIGFQAGIKWYDVILPHLDLQAEWNKTGPYMYASHYDLQNYTHFNQPLGHPTGGATDEVLVIANYRKKRWFGQLKFNQIYHSLGPDGYLSADPNITQNNIAPWPLKKVTQYDLEGGFFINPKINFQVLAGYTNRTDTTDYNWTEDEKRRTSFIYLAIRSNLINRYADF